MPRQCAHWLAMTSRRVLRHVSACTACRNPFLQSPQPSGPSAPARQAETDEKLRRIRTFANSPQTVDKLGAAALETHGESARGDWLFPLAFDICKNGNFFESFHFCLSSCRHFVDSLRRIRTFANSPQLLSRVLLTAVRSRRRTAPASPRPFPVQSPSRAAFSAG